RNGGIPVKSTAALISAIALITVCSVHADYGVTDQGTWPKSWPKELEPLRKQARTFEGPAAPNLHYAIRFTTQEEFESAWPHILKVKSKGAPLHLKHGPNFFLGEHCKASVVVHCPPLGQADNPATAEAPIAGATKVTTRALNTTYIELLVDGKIV